MTFPPDFTFANDKTVTAQVAAMQIASLAPQHRGVFQAGGCVGLWPVALGIHFDRVWTCEPAPSNFACLEENIAAMTHIDAWPVAIGARPASVGLTRAKPKAGLWHVEGDGDIPMATIDSLVGDAPIDAIVLDVEGYEAQALRGAERVIATHRPVLWFEFLTDTDEILDVLSEHGYARPRHAIGGDYYSTPQE